VVKAVFIGQVKDGEPVKLALAGNIQNVDPFRLLHLTGMGEEMSFFQLNLMDVVIYASNADIPHSKIHEIVLRDRYQLIGNSLIKQGVGMKAFVSIPEGTFLNTVLDLFLGRMDGGRTLAFRGFGNRHTIDLFLDIKNDNDNEGGRELDSFNGVAIRRLSAFFQYRNSEFAVGFQINLIFTIRNEDFDFGVFIPCGREELLNFIDLDLKGA
ncbi:hypothetical protein ROZALSC1DRAFT_29463, partial [Rozella allomycis CSF55]